MPSYYENERFQNLRLTEETVSGKTFVDCDFIDCAFERCQVSRCVLTECRFTRCQILDPKCEYSQVKFLTLEDCGLSGVNWGLLLPTGGFGDPLDRLAGCRLKYCFFTGMDLRRFDFTGSELTGCMFAECNLAESRFSGCGLADTEFLRCSLNDGDFRGAVGYKVDVPSCTLKAARFSLPEAANLLYSLGIRLE